MTRERWRRVEDLYHELSGKPMPERARLLDEACGSDHHLLSEVESLLRNDHESRLLDQPAGALAATLLGADEQVAPGTMLGPYRIECEIGSGGMGRVYKGTDTRLGRTVALKLSHTEFTERFEREARTVATLNHSHICQLYDVGPNYLVMEFVDGEPLRGPLPLGQAVQYATAILDALAAAHRKGIVHRDLKPANILVTKAGLKLLDFGLAKRQKVVQGAVAETTQTQALTGEGMVLGTLQYMAPEQIEGKPADIRSDLFSFGCVLYELLTGKRAFTGENPASVMAAIMERQPEPIEISPPLDRVIATCLAKDPDLRFQSAADLKRALLWSLEPVETAKLRRWPLVAAAAIALTASVGAGVAWLRQPVPLQQRLMRLQIPLPASDSTFTSAPGLSLSPDGRFITYIAVVAGRQGLWVHPLDNSGDRLLSDAPEALLAFWSPDSKNIGFFSGSRLLRIGLTGEPPVTLCTLKGQGRGGFWLPDGRIVFSSAYSGGVMQVAQTGGVPKLILPIDKSAGEAQFMNLQPLPGGRILFVAQTEDGQQGGAYISSFARLEQRTRLMSGDVSPKYIQSNDGKHYLVWRRTGKLVAQELDLGHLVMVGQPLRIIEDAGLSSAPNITTGGGILIYHAGNSGSQMMWVDRSGRMLEKVADPGRYDDARISPDGKRIAVSRSNEDGQVVAHMWLMDVERRVFSRLTFGRYARSAVWSPDGRTLLFQGPGPDGLRRKRVNEDGEESVPGLENFLRSYDWSGDSRFLLYLAETAATQRDLWVAPMTPDGRLAPNGKPFPYLRSPFNEYGGRFMPGPNPKWVAYQSDESGRQEVYIASFPDPLRRLQITTGGGRFPAWAPGGRELFYLSSDNHVMSVTLTAGPDGLEAGAPRQLFAIPPAPLYVRPFEVAPDGQRFLVTTPVGTNSIEVILNWSELLKNAGGTS